MATRMKIRKDDMVKVISGKDRGKTGRVLRTDPTRARVFVQGLNIQKRHRKAQTLQDTTRQQQIEGGVIEVEGPIHVSNVQLLDGDGNPTRVGIARDGKQSKRIAKRTGKEID
jgi:large subunit ribosomal protein L24